MKKLYSWNVNGLRACVSKGAFEAFIREAQPDVLGVQETKLQAGQITLDLPDYESYWNYAEKKGYSGTLFLVKKDFLPLSVTYGIGKDLHDHEGRVITLEYDAFFLVTVYTPNSGDELKRLSYRMEWEDAFLAFLKKLEKKKPVLFCGDLNVAHEEIDLKNPSSNHHSAGFTDEERGKFSALLAAGFVDTFRHFYPDKEGAYSWWSYRGMARQRNAGWRIDYFVASRAWMPKIRDALIASAQGGSDHCPVGVHLDL